MKSYFSKNRKRKRMVILGIFTLIIGLIVIAVSCNPKFGGDILKNQKEIYADSPNFENGAYYHNTMGKAILTENVIALNKTQAREFWNTMEKIYESELMTPQET